MTNKFFPPRHLTASFLPFICFWIPRLVLMKLNPHSLSSRGEKYKKSMASLDESKQYNALPLRETLVGSI